MRFENKCECGRSKVAGAIACSACYSNARRRSFVVGSLVICPDCRGQRRGPDGLLCRRCGGGAQINRSALRLDEVPPFEG
jgi:hypothetical protein